jgi:hypothetical protein
MLLALSLALVYGIILLPQENVLSGASDIGGMDRKLSAIDVVADIECIVPLEVWHHHCIDFILFRRVVVALMNDRKSLSITGSDSTLSSAWILSKGEGSRSFPCMMPASAAWVLWRLKLRFIGN